MPLPSRDDKMNRIRGRLMSESLMRLFDRVAGSREALPHLAALERGLIEVGSVAVTQIPPHWLARICLQLTSLPLPDDDPPLQDLQTRLLAALEALHAPPRPPGDFDPERTVVIREISHSEFNAAAAESAITRPVV